jgi:hypothetical protein
VEWKVRTIAVSIWLVLCLASRAAAEVQVGYDESVDFSVYKSYTWGKGTPAARPEFQEWIVEAIERELGDRGLVKTSGSDADLRVESVAFSELDVATRNAYVTSTAGDFGIITSGAVASATGTLMVDLLDAATNESVWRAVATEMMPSDVKPEKVRKVIGKVTKKMFRDFPPD